MHWKTPLLLIPLLAALCGCNAASPSGAVPPTATGISIRITTDIKAYSPAMDSHFGIHLYATDGKGNAVPGKWTATWGGFFTAENTDKGWKTGEPQEEWDNAANIWWRFPDKPNPNGEMPSAVSINFTGGGMSGTLLLVKSGPQTLEVSDSN